MAETHEKRGRAQRKLMKRKEKVERKQKRRDEATGKPMPDFVDPSHFLPPELRDNDGR